MMIATLAKRAITVAESALIVFPGFENWKEQICKVTYTYFNK